MPRTHLDRNRHLCRDERRHIGHHGPNRHIGRRIEDPLGQATRHRGHLHLRNSPGHLHPIPRFRVDGEGARRKKADADQEHIDVA
ncbi:hypothetical protein KJ781_00705 [Patescibacteria group bacterium]|nr:hypothetical protein [Patescibacteria group bacterium]